MNHIDEEVILEIEKRRKLADHYYDNFRKYFFHDFMDESMFEDDRKRTEKLLEKLVKILDAELKAGLKG